MDWDLKTELMVPIPLLLLITVIIIIVIITKLCLLSLPQ